MRTLKQIEKSLLKLNMASDEIHGFYKWTYNVKSNSIEAKFRGFGEITECSESKGITADNKNIYALFKVMIKQIGGI